MRRSENKAETATERGEGKRGRRKREREREAGGERGELADDRATFSVHFRSRIVIAPYSGRNRCIHTRAAFHESRQTDDL